MLHLFAKRLKELHEKKRDERGFILIELLVVIKRSVRERSTIPREARYVRSHIRSATTSRLFTQVPGRDILRSSLPIGLWRGPATSCPASLPHLTFHGVPDYIGSLEAGLATKGHAHLLHDPSGSEIHRAPQC
jgi:hypothetical protein